MEPQQLESNQMRNLVCHPNTIFSIRYHNYGVVVMSRPIHWVTHKMFEIWKKAVLTVTVNGGTYSWIQYLENAGIDVCSGQYNEFVPKVIIMKRVDRAVAGAPPTVIDKLESLGSKVIYVPRQNRTGFTKALDCIVDCADGMNLTLREMYVFAESITNFDTTQIVETLRASNGNIQNVEVVMVTNTYFAWMLRRGVHKIRVAPDTLDEEIDEETRPTCSFLTFESCAVNSLTTSGLETNFANASVTELVEDGLSMTCSENVVTVDTDASIIWVMSVDIIKEEMYDEWSDDESVDR